MRQKGPLKQFDEFDAWSFSRLGERIGSDEVKFDFPRLAEDENIVSSTVEFWEVSARVNAKSESVVRFKGRFNAELSCVVCGSGVEYAIDFERHLVLVTSEAQADAYDEETLDEHTDVVACPGAINLRDWLEDEILLACPMFPKHDACAEEAGRSWREEGDGEENTDESQDDTAGGPTQEVQRPFANLSDLLKGSKK
ncbi:YceD family protein [Limnobacter parvus]|uniref:YceD family protein n=1 Tax=Limnobacter parvus TaxID=2939690 RepID=A0ABT1XHZ1_9BURK|nr:YceD family protein [Limnobacter parvus]MCR2746903.1 YceD family protein [Limnobacter parvus]